MFIHLGNYPLFDFIKFFKFIKFSSIVIFAEGTNNLSENFQKSSERRDPALLIL